MWASCFSLSLSYCSTVILVRLFASECLSPPLPPPPPPPPTTHTHTHTMTYLHPLPFPLPLSSHLFPSSLSFPPRPSIFIPLSPLLHSFHNPLYPFIPPLTLSLLFRSLNPLYPFIPPLTLSLLFHSLNPLYPFSPPLTPLYSFIPPLTLSTPLFLP